VWPYMVSSVERAVSSANTLRMGWSAESRETERNGMKRSAPGVYCT